MNSLTLRHPTDRPNFTEVTLGELTVFFSYRTPIAFHTFDTGYVVSENQWSQTTGKHLNWIDEGDKKSRVPHSEMVERLNEITARMNMLVPA